MKHIVILILVLSVLAVCKEPRVIKIIERRIPPDTTKPAESEPKPAESEPKPAESEPKPAESEPKPAESEPKPAEPEPKPAESEPKPAEPEPKPAEPEPKLTKQAQAEWDRMCTSFKNEHLTRYCQNPTFKAAWYKNTWPYLLEAKRKEEARQKKAEEAKQKKAEEAKQKKAEEAKQKKAEEAKQKKAEEERQKKAEEEEAARKKAEATMQLKARKREMLRVYNEAKSLYDRVTLAYRRAKEDTKYKRRVAQKADKDLEKSKKFPFDRYYAEKVAAAQKKSNEAWMSFGAARNSEDVPEKRSYLASDGFLGHIKIKQYYEKHKTNPTQWHIVVLEQRLSAMEFRLLYSDYSRERFCKLGRERATIWCLLL